MTIQKEIAEGVDNILYTYIGDAWVDARKEILKYLDSKDVRVVGEMAAEGRINIERLVEE